MNLDSINAETYMEIRGRDLFSEILKNIEFIIDQKNRLQIALSFLIQRKNYKQVEDFVKLAFDYKVDRITFLVPNRMGDFLNLLSEKSYKDNVFLNEKEAEEWEKMIYPKLIRTMEKYQDRLLLPTKQYMQAMKSYFDSELIKVRTGICIQPLNSLFVNSDMNFKLCPYFDDIYTSKNINNPYVLKKERLKTFFNMKIKTSKCIYCMETQL